MKKLVLLLVLLCTAYPSAQVRIRIGSGGGTVIPPLVPTESMVAWNPGFTIPTRTTSCGTINAATYGNGASEASSGIQAAIDSCPNGQVLNLSAGIFKLDSHVTINHGITLRGAGVGSTYLQKTNYNQETIIVIGLHSFPSIDESTATNLTSDAVQGQFSVTVTSGTGFAVGQFVKLDEDDYDYATFVPYPTNIVYTSPNVLQSDRLFWPIRNPAPEFGDLPVPSGLAWHSRSGRPLSEIKEITGVSGNVITFADPITMTYRSAQQAQLTRYSPGYNHVRDVGVEDMTLRGGGDGNIQFLTTAYSWVKNIECTAYGNPCVDVHHSFRTVIRDSFIHDTIHPYPGGAGYSLSFQQGSSQCLVENNVISGANKMMVFRSAGSGCVVAYNYADNAVIGNYLEWVEVGLNASHMVGSHHVLFEGNRSFNYDSDAVWGSAIHMTLFRNYLTGVRNNYPGTTSMRAVGLSYGGWWQNIIGNVLGYPGMTGWIYEDPGDGTYGNSSSVWGYDIGAIYRLGYDPGRWGMYPDPLVRSRDLRDGNYDYVTNTVIWERPAQTLPNSLYLTSAPSFFASATWPWVEPLGSTKTYTLPAYTRGQALFAAATAPDPPRDVVATATGATTAQIGVRHPLNSGGMVVTLYTATSSPGGFTGTSNSTGIIYITGLTTGTNYTFSVTCTNIIGTSSATISNSITTP